MPTVGELVARLLTLDQSLPLAVSVPYDNGMAFSSDVGIQIEVIAPIGDNDYWDILDETYPEAVTAVLLIG